MNAGLKKKIKKTILSLEMNYSTSLAYEIIHRILRMPGAFGALDSVLVAPGGTDEAVVVSGSPRSGTTWLAEMLANASKKHSLVDEPLHLKNLLLQRHTTIQEWRPYVAPDSHAPRLRRYLEFTLQGRIPQGHKDRTVQSLLHRLIWGSPVVVKFVRGSRLLHWIANNFSLRGIVLLIRHPCAVVSSQITYKTPEWRNTKIPKPSQLQKSFEGWIPDALFDKYEYVLRSIDSEVGKLAVMWCLDTYIPLSFEDGPVPGHIVTYESLLDNTEKELCDILDYLRLPSSYCLAIEKVNPSSSASKDLRLKTEEQLSKWKSRLKPSEIDEILRVVDEFGISTYDDTIRPKI